jgi:hypothetical protein
MNFNENNFQIIRNFIEPDFVEFIQDYFSMKINAGDVSFEDQQVVGSYEWYSDTLTETILQNSCEAISKKIGIPIVPSYSFTRLYMKGDELTKHIDRASCEISATLSLGYSKDNYMNPIYFSKYSDERNVEEIILYPGDLCVYKGCSLYHWRPPIQNKWLLQTFLHFVNAEGEYKHKIYDERPYLGFPKN